MITFIFWLMSFLFFTCLGVILLQRLFHHKMVIYRRVSTLVTNQSQRGSHVTYQEDIKNRSLFMRFTQPLIGKLRLLATNWMPKQKVVQIERKLQAAGYPFGISAGDFVLIQLIIPAICSLVFVLLLAPLTEEKFKMTLLAIFIAIFTYHYTNYYLVAKRKQRVKQIDQAMPDFFDLLNVSIEAGMGLDGALKKVCHQMKTPLSQEFLSALEDMKLGKSRKQAFIELRDRVPSEFFKNVMSSIIQADQMGIGMSKVLRTQTERIREKQRFNAKEQAMKAPVKMLIPMVVFIFPTLFIVLLGPVVINLLTQYL
jgi:tight adherence protein C